MKRRGLQIRRRTRLLFYSVSLLLFVSGVSWSWINHLDEAGSAADSLRRAKTWLMAAHGISAVTFVLLLGILLVTHVRQAWQAGKNRGNGGFFLMATSLLTLSGYLLYYTSSEQLRAAISDFHLWLGAAAPVLLLWHIRAGKRAVRRETGRSP